MRAKFLVVIGLAVRVSLLSVSLIGVVTYVVAQLVVNLLLLECGCRQSVYLQGSIVVACTC